MIASSKSLFLRYFQLNHQPNKNISLLFPIRRHNYRLFFLSFKKKADFFVLFRRKLYFFVSAFKEKCLNLQKKTSPYRKRGMSFISFVIAPLAFEDLSSFYLADGRNLCGQVVVYSSRTDDSKYRDQYQLLLLILILIRLP